MTSKKGSYHHHDLRATLIRTSIELISEVGLDGFSVAKVAKRAGVSSGAPYRHFPDRESLLAETTIVFFKELTASIRNAVNMAGDDPIDRLAATAGAYVKYAIKHHITLDRYTAIKPNDPHFAEFSECSRELIDFLLSLALEVEPHSTWEESIELLQSLLAISQGFAEIQSRGSFSPMSLPPEKCVEQATSALRILIKGRSIQ
jgi:AcrR family transcriptional regulator